MQTHSTPTTDREGDIQAKNNIFSEENTAVSKLRIHIPKSPMIQRTGISQESAIISNNKNKSYLSPGSGLSSVGASPLSAGDLGKQIAATEVSNKISSKALLNVNGSRILSHSSRLDFYNTLEGSVDIESVKELKCIQGLICDGPSQSQEKKTIESKENISNSPDTPMTPAGMRLYEPTDRVTVTLEKMLRDASKIHGIQLSWILFGIIFIIIVIFFLLLGLVQVKMKDNIVVREQEEVLISAASNENQLELLHHSIKNILRLFESTVEMSPSLKLPNIVINHLCLSIGGAPLVFATYNNLNSSFLWAYTCPEANKMNIIPPSSLGFLNGIEAGSVRMAIYKSDFIIATATYANKSEILAVILQKEPIGRLIFANSIPAYSSSAVKHSSSSLFLPDFESLKLVVALHNLGKNYKSYNVSQPTLVGQRLYETFKNVCKNGNKYTWHSVIRPTSNDSVSSIYDKDDFPQNNMPKPQIDFNGAWGGVSHLVLCGALCYDSTAKYCTAENPTTTWFIIDNKPLIKDMKVALTAVTVICIVATIIFLAIVIVGYFSISVPVQHLKSLIFHSVGEKRKKSKNEKFLFKYTHNCWLGDLKALVKAFQLLSFCFRLNKKYVPQHIFEQQVLELQNRKDYLWRTIVEEIEDEEEGEIDDEDDEDVVPDNRDGMSAFVNTVSVMDGINGVSKPNLQEGVTQPLSNCIILRENSYCGPPPTDENMTGVHCIEMIGRGMTIVECATILSVHLCAVEMAYFTNYPVAVKQHRRIMNLLLGRIRHYRGELFTRSGDCIAATWNAFESRADHAQRAAACALSIAKLLEPYRRAGFRVGIVLHQGSFICGVVQDNKEAFTTVFGSIPRQAIALSELASSLPCFNVMVSEAVKQTLSSLYECIMVDVIKCHEDDTPIVMFELSDERRLLLGKGTPLISSGFAEEHARVFFHFRQHEFDRALAGVEQLRLHFPQTGCRLLRRIELLCQYYMHHENEIPLPYFRSYPTWPNYEAIANVDVMPELCLQGSKDDLLMDTYKLSKPSKSIYEDDTVKFRQELHDNVLASKRTQSTGLGTKASDTTLMKSGRTSSKVTPKCGPAISSVQPDIISLPQSLLTDKKSSEIIICQSIPISVADVVLEPLFREETTAWIETKDKEKEGTSLAEVSEGKRTKEVESVLSLRTPVNTSDNENNEANDKEENKDDDDDDDEEEEIELQEKIERQRFSFTNQLASVVMEGCSHSFLGVGCGGGDGGGGGGGGGGGNCNDSFVTINSDAGANLPSMTLRDIEGSFVKTSAEIPKEIIAKNGITYLRSSRILGKGSFGCVYLGMDVLSGRMVAIKFLPLPSEEEEITNVETEVVTMQKVKSPHVVEFISYAFRNNLIIIIMECMMAGSLQGLISSFGTIPDVTARIFIRDVLRGLHKLHSMGVIHRDVKPQNVLLTLSGSSKISDFGASAFLQELVRRQRDGKGLQIQGTPVYLAPEAARGTPEEKSDIWSCGVMFLQLVTGRLPYAGHFLEMAPQVLVFQIGSGAAVPIIPEGLDEFVAEFVKYCLHVDPRERLSAKCLLELPMFAL